MSNNKLASENFIESIAAAKKINGKSLWAFGLKGLAEVYTLEGKYPEAIAALIKAREISNGVNDLILNDEIYYSLSDNYLAINKWDEFKKYHLIGTNIQKLIKARERISVSESLDAKEAELKSKVLNETSNFYWLFLLLGSFFIIFLVLFYLFIKRKTKEIIAIKNKIHLLQNQKIK